MCQVIKVTTIIISISLISKFSLVEMNDNLRNSCYVITKDEESNKNKYYYINENGNCRKCKKFEPDEMEIFTVTNCYDSYISGNRVLNRLTLDTCVIIDNTGKSIEVTGEFSRIIKKVSLLEHSIMDNKIFRLSNKHYVIVSSNVNLWSPYSLYYYDNEEDQLIELYTFNGENVVGIKLEDE